MKSNQERHCRDCDYTTVTINGDKVCALDNLPLGPLVHTHGCVPMNFLYTSEFEAMDEDTQADVREFLEADL